MRVTLTLTGVGAPSEPQAWELLQRAQGFLQKWPEGFRGFRARLRCDGADGGGVEGTVVVPCGLEPLVDLDPPDLRQVVRARLLDCAAERTPRFFKDGDGRFTVRREPDGGEPWIRVERPDGTIRYRLDVRGRIVAVERLDPDRHHLTVIEEYARATPGRVLPARRQTTTREIRTGARLAWEQLREAHCRVDHVWLPAAWDIVAETALGSRALRVEVLTHQLL